MLRQRFLQMFLRVMGSLSLLALIAALAPRSWFASGHAWLGMGEYPTQPIVGYLARSTSAFYGLLGALFWVLSYDVAGNRRVLRSIGVLLVCFGVVLVFVGIHEAMPLFWILSDGPVDIGIGVVLLQCSREG